MLFARRRLRSHGERATATVLSCEYRSKFWIVGLRPKEGDEDVPVCFDAATHETVFGEFGGDPRYDVDALNAQTKARREEVRALRDRLQ
jgi:hypothetical protein